MSKEKPKRRRRVHTPEFKADTVKLVREGGCSVTQVSQELGLAESLVRYWMRQSATDADPGSPGAITTAEKEELLHLRREVKVLRMEREILKRAGDYRRALDAHAIKRSMSRKGDCWDNAVAESFFASLKREWKKWKRSRPSRADPRRAPSLKNTLRDFTICSDDTRRSIT
jgi:transposase